MSKQAKFNPNNSATFVPTSLSSSSSQTSQQNMSSHSAPPAANPKSRSGANGKKGPKNQKPRESHNNNNQRRGVITQDDFSIDLEDEMLALGSFPRARRGQVSINHLLDFSLPSREDQLQGQAPPVRRRRRSSNKDRHRIHLVGQQFVNANYKFIVDYRFDYKAQILDPNVLLDHNHILRVIVPKGHHCPICLTEDVIAPRMISCGHIFCHSCLLSFLDSEPLEKKKEGQYYHPKKLKECPLCSEYVRPAEVVPVLVNDVDERFEIPQIGQDVVLKLMARPMDNILPIPHSLNLNHTKIGNSPWYSDTELYQYARILKGGLKFVVDQYEAEKVAIIKQYEEDKLLYNDDGKYVNKALSEIDEQLKLMKSSFGDNYNEPNTLVNSMENLSISKNDSGLDDSNCFFFYQTSFNSTTRFFLSPLDVKVLLRTYGSYANFPTTLLVKVDNVNYGYMVTEQLLKRYKYMGHLPCGAEFAFIDVNWKNMLPPEIYKLFSKELSDRRRKLLSRLKREDRDKKTYETEIEKKAREFYMQENQGWGSYDFLSSQENFGSWSESALPDQLHPLGDDEIRDQDGEEEEGEVEGETAKEKADAKPDYTTTVWGTKIPKSTPGDNHDEFDDDPFNTEELLKFALSTDQDQNGGKKKKKGRKKLLVLSTTGNTRNYK
ncbi:CYFA0S25e01068g1_1 [Cyberlindnera fabianii]|uniref:CYFA0S25e01068g1_1 n=1 Tax=Cyberlindnera fabianii TaxID=36022 RepID=A0A061BFN6_CYBFA|nr:RING-finger protein MAG2 [Cyberlindnera fabianii]CDR46697.1 CYFA0S25e01068g1_1 [Cyberlindnera fabianii]